MVPLRGWQHFAFLLILFVLIGRPFYVRCSKNLNLNKADSWGTEFVFIIPPNKIDKFQAKCYFIGLDDKINIALDVEYSRIVNSKVKRKKDKLNFRGNYIHNFRNLVANDRKKGLHMLGDDRIHITSSEKITITCYINDNQSFVEMFLVHPVGMGGDYYAFSLPGRSTMTLYFLPLGTTNETMSQNHDVHNVSITLKQTNNKLETIKQDMKAGSLWQYTAPVERTVSIWIRDQLNNHSAKEIESTERAMSDIGIPRMMVIASIRDISIGGVKKTDFSCFMPTPLIVDRCAKLTNPVYHPVIKAFANDFLFTAPSHQCPQDVIDIRSSMRAKPKLLSMKWDKEIDSAKSFILSSETAMMNIVNFGGGKGTFIYEIPEYSQWITDHVIPVRIPKNYNATLRAIGAQGEEAPHNITLHHAAIASDTIWIFHVEGNFDRYLPIVIAETDQTSVGYIPAINRRRIPSSIFAKPTLSAPLTAATTMKTTKEECIHDFTETKPTSCANATFMVPAEKKTQERNILDLTAIKLTVSTAMKTQAASLLNLFAICIYFMSYGQRQH